MKKPTLILALTASVFSSLALPAQAAPRLSTQSIIVNPVPTTLEARVWVDRDTSGTRTPTYRIGDRIQLSVSVNENAYVYLFCLSPDGSVDQIFPNRLGSGNYVRKGEVRRFPSSGDNFVFNVGGPAGLNKVLVIASRRQLNLSELSTFSAGDAFATVKPQGSQQLAQALSIVVNPVAQPIPQQDWVSDIAFFNAVR